MSEDVDTRGPRVAHARCPFCHDDVRPDDEAKLGCSACMAWHHEPCWSENGGCAACGHDVAPRSVRATTPVSASKEKEADATSDDAGPRRSRAGPIAAGVAALAVAIGAVGLAVRVWRAEVRRADDAAWRARLERATTEEERTAAVRDGAKAGDPGAMNMLGFRLMTGTGCARDPAGALEWGERAAEAGHAEAMYGTAMLLEMGDTGVPRDEARAVALYRRAVAAGDTMAGPRLDALLRRRPDLR